jgi:hypothetical protein
MGVWQIVLESGDVGLIVFPRKMGRHCSEVNNSLLSSLAAATIVFSNPEVAFGEANEVIFLIQPLLVEMSALFWTVRLWTSPSVHRPPGRAPV